MSSSVELMQRQPIYDTIDEQMLVVVQNTVAKDASGPEISMFLEVCARFDLDPFAKEVWCAVSNPDNASKRRVLIMVGRDGLRKVAHRAGLEIRSDVVRKNDHFAVKHTKDRRKVITHEYAVMEPGVETPENWRGDIVGAWAEVYDPETGESKGFNYSPMVEYRPTSEAKLKFSPWGTQESVMIMAAAERNALRQATPLGGLLSEGEMDLNDELASGMPLEDPAQIEAFVLSLDCDEDLKVRIAGLVAVINEIAPGQMNIPKLQMMLLGKGDPELEKEAEHLAQILVELREGAGASSTSEDVVDATAEEITNAEPVA